MKTPGRFKASKKQVRTKVSDFFARNDSLNLIRKLNSVRLCWVKFARVR